jgi:transcription elongation factor
MDLAHSTTILRQLYRENTLIFRGQTRATRLGRFRNPHAASSAHDLAQALHCQPTGSPTSSPDGYTLITCTYQGRRLAIYWRDAKITAWPGETWSREELWGNDSRWNIDCATHNQCVNVQSTVGGHFSNTIN